MTLRLKGYTLYLWRRAERIMATIEVKKSDHGDRYGFQVTEGKRGFDLTVISRYFPEYEREIVKRL